MQGFKMEIDQCRIVICGGIAVGKTTVGRTLAQQLDDCQFIEEKPIQNKYLADFYADKKRWGFHSRIAMLSLFIDYYNSRDKNRKFVVFDRCVNELITFARLQYKLGNMTKMEYYVYKQLFNGVIKLIEPMNVFVYLYCNEQVALDRISARGRNFELKINREYLSQISNEYDIWIRLISSSNPVLKVDTSVGVDYKSLLSELYNTITLI